MGLTRSLAASGYVDSSSALLSWLLWRPVRQEITETEVRAGQGWVRGQAGKNDTRQAACHSSSVRAPRCA